MTTPLAFAQSGGPTPEELWTFETEGGADANDVAIDADGKVIAAVQADASAVRSEDDEVFAWDLVRSTTSASPVMRGDPTTGVGAPEGLSVVAIEPNPGSKGDFLAVGNEGTSESTQNNVYVYRRSSGGASETPVSYSGGREAPTGAVEDIWFFDRDTLLVYHADALSLLERQTGTEYRETQDGRWSPGGETIQDVAISRNSDRIAVLTSETSEGFGNTTLKLRVLDASGGSLEVLTEDPWTRSRTSADGQLAFSRNGNWALVGTAGKTIFYMGIHETENDEGDTVHRFSEFPWSRNGPDDVSEVALSPRGDWLAVGFANAQLILYERTDTSEEGPRAERAFDTPIDTRQAPMDASFADGNRSLFVQADGLIAFHQRQFRGEEPIRPLWRLPTVEGFAVSQDGQRLATIGAEEGDGIVQAHEQSYNAQMEVEVPRSVQPGRTFNVSVTVENNGSAFDAYRFGIGDLSGAWNVDTPDEALELLPGESSNSTVRVTPSATQAPGDVSFTVRAISQFGPGQPNVAQQQATVEVQELHAADLDVDTSQQAIDQGATIEIEPEVTNAGNTAESFVLRIGQDASWTIRIDGEETSRVTFELDPQASHTPSVEVQAPSDAPKGTRNTLEFIAHPEEGGRDARASLPIVVEPSYGAEFGVPDERVDVEPGEIAETEVTVVNDGNTEDTFNLEVESNASNPEHLWDATLSTQQVTLEGEAEETITVTVSVPRGAEEGDTTTVTLRAFSSATGDRVGEASYELGVPSATDDAPLGAIAAIAAVSLAALAARRRPG